MKANGVPEKIYLQQYDENTLICLNKWNVSEEWSNKPCNEKVATNIEYTRTDAFIEKACEYWYQYNRDIVKKHGARAVLGCSEFTVNVEGFKKYMEDKL